LSSYPPFRIGHGYDVHAFEAGDQLMLAGVGIPHDRGFKAHSDGDVAIHALCDALLGAVAAGDIGQLFPDRDPQYADMDSRIFLRQVAQRVAEAGYQVANVDLTIVAQAPKMAPHIDAMCDCLSRELQLERHQVSVKATTTERLGFEGQQQGIAVHAVALLVAC
jgi:2-C-methyl-D-erythritol 2,4-cyclodiphosphate synthase